MRVLLDTQAVYIAAGSSEMEFSRKARAILEDPDNERMVSSASVMEVAIKNACGKMIMTEAQMRQAATDLCLTIIPFSPQYAYRLFALPQQHRDPFDRMLIATALVEGVPVISSDREFKRYKGLSTIW